MGPSLDDASNASSDSPAVPLRPADLARRKQAGLQISMLTAWDALSGAMVAEAGADALLVGDSLAMVVLGHPTTLPVTLDEMLHHCRAVARGVASVCAPGREPLLILDLPFLTYQCGLDDAVAAAGRALKESPAAAVKLEGAEPETLVLIDRLVRCGIPAMGHVGLTPQSVHRLGYRRQGLDQASRNRLEQDAAALEEAGCFAVVLEHVPDDLAAAVAAQLTIPVIGIGAGAGCDGQVRVTADLLGLTSQQPPFSQPLLPGRSLAVEALRRWIAAQAHPGQSTSSSARAAPHCSGPAPLDR